MKLKDILSEAIKIQGKPDHWPGDDHIILVTPTPTKTYVLKFNNKNDSSPNSIRFPNSMGTKPVDTNKAAREFWLKIKADVVKWRSTNESVNESTEASDIIKDLDKVKNDLLKKVDVLIAKKKKLYSDVDITTPMSADEKKLDKDIADLFSQINTLVLQKRSLKESELKGYLAADVVDDIVKVIGSKMVKGHVENAPNRNYIYLKLTDIKFGNDVVKMLKSKFGIDAKIDKTFGNIPTVSFASKKVVSEATLNEKKYYVTYNKGRGQGKGLSMEFDKKTFRPLDKPKVFNSYKDAKKYADDMEKTFRNSIGGGTAYWVSDEKMNPIKESINEGRGIKSIQNDLDKTVIAIESEIASYKATKGTPQEKKHIDNLKKLHPIKKKLQSELDMVVSGLYRDAELKIENLISIKEATIKVGGNGKTINGYEVEYFKTARGVYANIEIPSPNPTFDDDTQIKGFGKDEKEAFNDLKKELEKYLKNKK